MWTRALTAVFVVLVAGCTVMGQADVTVTINPQVEHQRILGWGKSTPWLAAPQTLRDQVLDRAVNDLGLTRLRLEAPSGNRTTHRNWEWLLKREELSQA